MEAAVCMVDVLGYRNNPLSGSELVKLMDECTGTIKVLQKAINTKGRPICTFEALFISDTLVIVAKHRKGRKSDPGMLILSLALHMVTISQFFWSNNLPWRGCISYGEVIASKSFIAGKAVFDAATYMNESHEAAIWCTRTALETLEASSEARFHMFDSALIDYDISTKSGPVRTKAVNLFLTESGLTTAEAIRSYLKLMSGGGVDIWVKHSATERFFQHIQENGALWSSNLMPWLYIDELQKSASEGKEEPKA